MSLPRVLLGAAAAVVVVAAVAGATVLIVSLTSGRGTVLDRMVPSDALGYGSLNLDPPADQKLDLLRLSQKFPELGSQTQVDQSLDKALKPFGLTYTSDVKPWLGAQVVGVVSGSKPEAALLLDSKDDGKAKQALAKARTGPEGRKLSWHAATHGGVSLEVGSSSSETDVLAYFDHTALVSSSEALADEIIDTDQGKHSRLDSNGEYRTMTGRLPSSRLVTIYVSGDGLRTGFKAAGQAAAKPPAGSLAPGLLPSLTPSLQTSSLDGYRGFAAAVSARPDGLTGDFEVDVDTSKLPASQQAIFQAAPRANTAMTWMPGSATGVVATTKLDAIAKALQGTLQQSGFKSTGVLDSLTGDAAVEAEPTASGSGIAFGAVIGSSDPAAIVALVDQLGAGQIVASAQGPVAVVASSQDELARLQSAHAGGARLTETAAFKKADDYAVANPDSLVYVDVQSAFRLAGRLGLQSNGDFQQQRSKWSALNTVLVTSGINSSGGSTKVRILVS